MSKTITLTEDRLQELFELTIAKTKAIQNQEAPNSVISNSNVYITNNYGDTYEEDHGPAPSTKAPKAQGQNIVRVRPELLRLCILAEKKMQEIEAVNPDGFSTDPASTKQALVERFAHLQLKLKGDTSIDSVQDAYLWMLIQLVLASNNSGVFDGEG